MTEMTDLRTTDQVIADAIDFLRERTKGAPRSKFVDSPYNTPGPRFTVQGGGELWRGHRTTAAPIVARVQPVAVAPMGLPRNNIAPSMTSSPPWTRRAGAWLSAFWPSSMAGVG